MWRPKDWKEEVEKQSEELDNNRRFDSRDYKIFEAGADTILKALATLYLKNKNASDILDILAIYAPLETKD